MSNIHQINNRQWRAGMIKGMWNAIHPNDPEFPQTEDSDYQTLRGYNFGYNNPERAKELLEQRREEQEWS